MMNRFWTLLAAGLLLPALGCDQSQTDGRAAELAFQQGVDWQETGDWQMAVDSYSEALKLDPISPRAFFNRGMCYEDLGKLEMAIDDYSQAIRLAPRFVEAYTCRGIARTKRGMHGPAISDFRKVVDLQPDGVDVRINLAQAYETAGQPFHSITQYTEAIRLSEDSPDAHRMLATLLATYPDERCRNGEEAVKHATKACELTQWQDWLSLSALGAAYAEAGDFDKAVEYGQKALKMAPQQDRQRLQMELAAYQKGQPVRRTKPKTDQAP